MPQRAAAKAGLPVSAALERASQADLIAQLFGRLPAGEDEETRAALRALLGSVLSRVEVRDVAEYLLAELTVPIDEETLELVFDSGKFRRLHLHVSVPPGKVELRRRKLHAATS